MTGGVGTALANMVATTTALIGSLRPLFRITNGRSVRILMSVPGAIGET